MAQQQEFGSKMKAKIRSHSKGDKKIQAFLGDLYDLEMGKGERSWWKDDYRKKLKSHSEKWGGSK